MSDHDRLRHVCIIGAGIAGLAAAITLRGHVDKITLLDAAESIECLNVRAAGLTAWPCAVNVLHDSFGVHLDHNIHAVQGETAVHHSWAGDVLQTLRPNAKWYMAHRGALLDALLQKALDPKGPGNVPELKLGQKVVHVDPSSGTATCSDKTTYTADLLIGAEGVRSITRRAILPTPPIVSPSGLSVYRFTLHPSSWSHLSPTLQSQINAAVGPEARILNGVDDPARAIRLVIYRCHSTRHTVNGALILPNHQLPESSSEDWAARASVAALQRFTADIAEPWRSILSCVSEAGLWQLRRQQPLRTWSRGRAVILGDAAHPMLPFQAAAAALAFEDAEALGFALAEVGFRRDAESVELALRRVFAVRWMRASLIQWFSDRSPFEEKVMGRARAFAEDKAKRDGDRGGEGDGARAIGGLGEGEAKGVPVVRDCGEDGVQKVIRELVQKNAGNFDSASSSAWVWDYKSAADWVSRKGEYVLEKGFEEL